MLNDCNQLTQNLNFLSVELPAAPVLYDYCTVWLVSSFSYISYNARRLSRKLRDVTIWHEARHPRTSKQRDECHTKNGTADHDIVSPISQTSAPYLAHLTQHLAHVRTREDNIFVDA